MPSSRVRAGLSCLKTESTWTGSDGRTAVSPYDVYKYCRPFLSCSLVFCEGDHGEVIPGFRLLRFFAAKSAKGGRTRIYTGLSMYRVVRMSGVEQIIMLGNLYKESDWFRVSAVMRGQRRDQKRA